MRKMLVLLLLGCSTSAWGQTWTFAVAGDSRNCGDVVMPAIAAGAKAGHAAFYWHLGDFRRITNIDDDMKAADKNLDMQQYLKDAWPDFLRNQIAPFAPLLVYLGIGNHELNDNRTRAQYLAQFRDWQNHETEHTYFHWIVGNVELISLDNASKDMFDDAQVAWLVGVLKAAAIDPSIKTVVVGMHAALPHSLSCNHSMNESPQGEKSGVAVYKMLLEFSKRKRVYVLASHSHFLFKDVYASDYWKKNGGVLPGSIIGTAGAIRYELPDTAETFPKERARTDVYGYFLATVSPNGEIAFDFKPVAEGDVPGSVSARYPAGFVHQCFAGNHDPKPQISKPCAAAP